MANDLIDNTKEIPLDIEATAGAYLAGDVVGGLLEFPVTLSSGGGGRLVAIYMTDEAGQNDAYKIYIYSAKPTEIDDNDAWESAQVLDDLKRLKRIVTLSAGLWQTIDTKGWVELPDLNLDFDSGSDPANSNLYMYLVTTAGQTQTGTDKLAISAMMLLN